MVAAVSDRVGGPLGRWAYGRRRWFTPVGVLLLLASLTFAIGMVQKTSCYNATWSNGDDRYLAMCYSDLPPLYIARGFAEGHWPYSDDDVVRERYPDVMEYPVGISYWAWASAKVTHLIAGTSSADLEHRASVPVEDVGAQPGVTREIRIFTAVNAVGLAIVTIAAAGLLARVNRRRPWDAAALALSPTLALTGLINWDLIAVFTVAGALWAWARGRPVLTGVFLGLGAATKLYPLFLLGGVLVLCLRRQRWRALAATFGAAAAAWVLAQVPAWLTGPVQWQVFWEFNADRGADLGSIWLVIAQSLDLTISASTINLVSWGLFGLWCVGVLAVGWYAKRQPTLAELGFLIIVGFVLVNKVYSPQYVLWLLPLAVLAVPRWRDQLIWQGTEILYFCAVWWYLAGELEASGDVPFYWTAILLRMVGELYLVWLVVRDLMTPSTASQEMTTSSKFVAV